MRLLIQRLAGGARGGGGVAEQLLQTSNGLSAVPRYKTETFGEAYRMNSSR